MLEVEVAGLGGGGVALRVDVVVVAAVVEADRVVALAVEEDVVDLLAGAVLFFTGGAGALWAR